MITNQGMTALRELAKWWKAMDCTWEERLVNKERVAELLSIINTYDDTEDKAVAWMFKNGASTALTANIMQRDALLDRGPKGDLPVWQCTPLYTHPQPDRSGVVSERWKLGMAVLQSTLYLQLSDENRAICDALVSANPNISAVVKLQGEFNV